MMAVTAFSAFMQPTTFHIITAALMAYVASWTGQMSIFSVFGAWKMRQAVKVDWHSKLVKLQEEMPNGDSDATHIVILPNYKEDETMLAQTLSNIGRSPMARENIRVVLAMEAREGPSGQRKAERLIEKTSHLFAGMIATFHPANLPGEIAGKSSNTQWGYREAMRSFAPLIARLDPSKVFLTVGDADTLWHPQFFSALAYEGLTIADDERAWRLWQPPVLLLRNLWSVPGPTRVSAYGTFMFELSGLANQYFGSHMAYSAYSTTLALASHPEVGGWDTDVIAEDHHMFCKCFFASIWEVVNEGTQADTVRSKVQLSPVYLPAISYLVESDDGWAASCHARFQQARRHSQGVAEISYVFLQYVQLLRVSLWRMPFKTHWNIIAIAWKMLTVHIINTVQAFSLLCSFAILASNVVSCLVVGGGYGELLDQAINLNPHGLLSFAFGQQSEQGTWAIFATFGTLPPLGMLTTVTMYVVIKDLMEGRYTQAIGLAASPAKEAAATTVVSKEPCEPLSATELFTESKTTSLGVRQRLQLFFMINWDMWSLAEQTIIAYGLIPEVLAAWSLMFYGHRFEYIVAAKPNAQ
jgi:hypothetical protein